jgi:hypothetical protein
MNYGDVIGRCENCQFYDPDDNCCRRFPPQCTATLAHGQIRILSDFPKVDRDVDWCGEWQFAGPEAEKEQAQKEWQAVHFVNPDTGQVLHSAILGPPDDGNIPEEVWEDFMNPPEGQEEKE